MVFAIALLQLHVLQVVRDSSLFVPIKWNENGDEQNTAGGSGSGRLVWTGSKGDGTIDPRPLGNVLDGDLVEALGPEGLCCDVQDEAPLFLSPDVLEQERAAPCFRIG